MVETEQQEEGQPGSTEMHKAADSFPAAAPQWTTLANKRGQDPLGMQALCISLYQTLVPGISNVTLRMRYYGFYAWLCSHYARDVTHTAQDRWKRYLRRAEALLALVTMRSNMAETGISGVNWARALLRQKLDVMPFHTGTDQAPGEPQYLSQDLGAFRAAYGSQLRAVGVLQKRKEDSISFPTIAGEAVALAYSDAVGVAGQQFMEIADRGIVTSAELDSLAALSIGAIASEDERTAYEGLLFQRTHTTNAAADSRRLTLELVLRMTAEFGMRIDVQEVRWSAYSQRAPNGQVLDLPTDELKAHRFAWAVYHGNDLLHAAYECLFLHTLQHLARSPAGMRPEILCRDVSAGILEEWEVAPDTWHELMKATELAADAWSTTDPNSEFQLAQSILGLRSVAAACGSDLANQAVTLLAVLTKRFKPEEAAYLKVLEARYGQAVRLEYVYSLVSEFRFLESLEQAPLSDTLQRLVRRILERHTWIAFQKLRYRSEYTFLLENQDGLLRTRGLDGPMLTNPRLASAIGFMSDIRLVGDQGITPLGTAALERLQ